MLDPLLWFPLSMLALLAALPLGLLGIRYSLEHGWQVRHRHKCGWQGPFTPPVCPKCALSMEKRSYETGIARPRFFGGWEWKAKA